MVNFTPETLLLFMYGELPEDQSRTIEEELAKSWTLREKFKVLKEAADRLDKTPMQAPRQESVNAILQYAQSAKVGSEQ